MSISHFPIRADEEDITLHGYEAGASPSRATRSDNDTTVEMRLNETNANVQELNLPDPYSAEEPTDISIKPPQEEPDQEGHEQPAKQEWFEATYGMAAILYQKCMDIWSEGKGDPAKMQDVLLEVERYLSWGLATIRKPQADVASSFDPIAQCQNELKRLYEYASVLLEELQCDTEEMLPPVDKKTRAAQAADRDVEVLREEWVQRGWGKLTPLKETYTLITWRGLQFNEKKARTDAYNARYQALVTEEQNRLLKKSKKENALKMVKSGISRMQWHYEAAERANKRRIAWEEEQAKEKQGQKKGLLGSIGNAWSGIKNFGKGGSLVTRTGLKLKLKFDVGGVFEDEFRQRLREVDAARKSGKKTTAAA